MMPEQAKAIFAAIAIDYRVEMSIDEMLDGFAVWLADARDRLALSDEDFNTLCAIGGMMFRHGMRSGFDEPDEVERIAKELLEKYGKPRTDEQS